MQEAAEQDKIILPNEFLVLAEEELKSGKSVTILADGASMDPFIKGGKDHSIVVPWPENSEMELWKAYMFRHNGKYIIHRYIGNKGDKLIMMGDGNLELTEEVSRGDIIGLLKNIKRHDGKIIDATNKRWMRKGRIWNRLLPFRRYLLAFYRRLLK